MLSVVSRLETAAERSGTVTFVGSAAGGAGATDPVEWARLHDEARGIAAALQARGVGPGVHVGILGPTTRALVTTIQATFLAGGTVVALPLPMRLGSIEEFVEQTRPADRERRHRGRGRRPRPRAVPRPAVEAVGAHRAARRAGARRRARRRRRVEAAPGRSRAAGHPPVHERLDRRAQGRHAPRPLRRGEHRRHHRRRRHHAKPTGRCRGCPCTTTWGSSGC